MMLDEKDLQAISQMLAQQKQDLRQEIMQDVKTLLDSEFTPRFNLLAENQDEILRRVPTEEDEELWNTRLAALEAMVKKHSREIAALRKAN